MTEKRRSRILTQEEADKVMTFLARADPDDYPIYWLMLNRGLRVGEIVSNHSDASKWGGGKSNLPGLQIEDLKESGVHVKGKKGHDDFIPLPKMIVNMLRSASGKRQTGPIFQHHASLVHPEMAVNDKLKHACRDVGIEDWQYVHPHALRHGFGFKAARKTKDIFKVRDLMRHKNIAMSSRYVHDMSPEEKKEVLESLDEGMEGGA
jgi:integrase